MTKKLYFRDVHVTSHKILRNGSLRVISPSVANGQIATCWIAANDDGFVYTANTGSDTISLYELVSGNGRDQRRFDNDKKRFKSRSGKSRLELLDFAAGYGVGPIDLTTAGDGRFFVCFKSERRDGGDVSHQSRRTSERFGHNRRIAGTFRAGHRRALTGRTDPAGYPNISKRAQNL